MSIKTLHLIVMSINYWLYTLAHSILFIFINDNIQDMKNTMAMSSNGKNNILGMSQNGKNQINTGVVGPKETILKTSVSVMKENTKW